MGGHLVTVIAEISMSADGIVAGPDTSAEHRLGKDGDLLHGDC